MKLHSDGNAKEIVAELRDGGIFEYWRGMIKRKGIPDGVYGFAGQTVLIEIKSATGVLSEGQEEWHRKWLGGPIRILRSVQDAKDLKKALLLAAERMAGLD